MDAACMMAFLHKLEKLKCNTRHSWTSTGRHESVAEHSWRLGMMALLLRENFPELDMDKVVEMCLLHDIGEAVTGDIPSFEKTDRDCAVENTAIDGLLSTLQEPEQSRFQALFAEMEALETPEARLYKALDRLEAVIQHNEAPLDTWLELEYTLNQTYGVEDCAQFPATQALRALALEETKEKIRK
ncbi:MAG TPA: HD domain-containing protein [Candidatus Flavonifractor merdipullorum]|uniref:5'-deoxynucleotidase n=1 Tax=Candidatus Flavonifractor merdipullorum TaxID=2838590 RepID=A0A9D1UND5_9FIRM|nr:HD domain-containing protein [Candidatus Flavonifractor merdipullorum]